MMWVEEVDPDKERRARVLTEPSQGCVADGIRGSLLIERGRGVIGAQLIIEAVKAAAQAEGRVEHPGPDERTRSVAVFLEGLGQRGDVARECAVPLMCMPLVGGYVLVSNDA